MKDLNTLHSIGQLFDKSVILLNDIVYIFDL